MVTTYEAGIATIRRTTDGMLSTMWGLYAEGRPVVTDKPGPWTRPDGDGGTWEHVGHGVADGNAFLLFDYLEAASEWVVAHPPSALLVEGRRWAVGRYRDQSCRDAHCTRHEGMTYVPIQGWLEAAEAQREHRAYLDMDAAIDRAYDA